MLEALDPGPQTAEAVRAARATLERAIEEESAALAQLEAVRVAHERVRAELEREVRRHQRAEEAAVLRALDSTYQRDKAALRDVMDRLFLRARLRGNHSSLQNILGATLDVSAHAAAAISRSSRLFLEILKQESAP